MINVILIINKTLYFINLFVMKNLEKYVCFIYVELHNFFCKKIIVCWFIV